MIPYKNRVLNPNKPVKVYRNVNIRHKKMYSIKQSGLVIGHTENITLLDAKFVVMESSRMRINKKNQKEFCAYIEGTVFSNPLGLVLKNLRNLYPVKFNPYLNKTFVDEFNNEIDKSALVLIGEKILAFKSGIKFA